jgi:hypothetical protein
MVALALGASALLPACGGPTFDGKVYRSDSLSFRVGPVPASWHTFKVDGTLLAFRDDDTSATIAVNGRCGVDGDDVPLSALTHHLLLGFTERRIQSQAVLPFDGREALRSELSAKLDGVPRHLVVYVLKKDSCVYDLWWIGSEESAPASLENFQGFVQGFSTQI